MYAYWMDMKKPGDGHCRGNFMEVPAERRAVPERGCWYCMEWMVKANDPRQANGELAAWVDGQLYHHYTHYRWRSTDQVRLMRASFGIYIHETRKVNRAWYDDVAFATGHIGPLPELPSCIEEKTWGKVKGGKDGLSR